MADILLLEDDAEYAGTVRARFAAHGDAYELHLRHASTIEEALVVSRELDVRVAIIDLSLGEGAAGTDAISSIWRFDKKVVFIIHSVFPAESIADWSARLGVPYTSQFFLQKSGANGSTEDAERLYELTLKALRAYVPHLAPPLMSVGDVVSTVSRYVERNPSFRPSGVVGNIHHSQDVMNAASQWAADRLARAGYDATRIAVLMTGSFARLEASSHSDADYFVVFDDSNESPQGLEDIAGLAYSMFMEVAGWFERTGIPVHDAGSVAKTPAKVEWHSITLPTWFPLSTLRRARLGRTTQLELTKQWFLLESRPIFNPQLVARIHALLAEDMRIASQKSVRDAIGHSGLTESIQMLTEEFEYAFRHRQRDSLKTVKHFFMRLVNLFSLRLWLLRCFLDPKLFEQPSQRLFEELSPLPAARIIEFGEFLQRVPLFDEVQMKRCVGALDAIVNAYGEAAHAFGSDELRNPGSGVSNDALINDLEDAARLCGEKIADVRRMLAESTYVSGYAELATRKII